MSLNDGPDSLNDESKVTPGHCAKTGVSNAHVQGTASRVCWLVWAVLLRRSDFAIYRIRTMNGVPGRCWRRSFLDTRVSGAMSTAR